MRRYCILIVLVCLSCENQNKTDLVSSLEKVNIRNQKEFHRTQPKLEELFVDSTEIGKKSYNKIEVAKYTVADSCYAVIKFYTKQNKKWDIKNEFHFKADSLLACDPQVSDFNNDGFNDITYVSLRAARSANEVRNLFIYDKENDKLIYIKNSEDYPNMLYNNDLNCIDAFLISGCNVTAFLKIEKDSLRQFASVDQCDILTVTTYDQKGREKVILTKKTNKYNYTRFKNYSPLKEYD